MKCKDCSVPPKYDYQENCKLRGLFGITLMSILKFMLMEKMEEYERKLRERICFIKKKL